MEIWEPKPPGNLWATPDLLQESYFPGDQVETNSALDLVFTVFDCLTQRS